VSADESGYVDVDQTEDPVRYIRRLDAAAASPFWQAVKPLSYSSLDLRPGDRVLDVGCGTGDDVRAMAARVLPDGAAVGVDSSGAMLAEARQRTAIDDPPLPVIFEQADATNLPFEAASFTRCRVERLLQHLDQPHRAIQEMVRVVAPAGLVLAIEPDYGSLSITGADAGVTRRVVQDRARHFRSGRVGSALQKLFKEAGLVEVRASILVNAVTGLEDAERGSSVVRYLAAARANGVVSDEEGRQWLADLRTAHAAGRYRQAVPVFVVVGRRP
jgi:SAM-dependent methyltransferase